VVAYRVACGEVTVLFREVDVIVHLFIHTQLRSFEFTNYVQIRSGIFSRTSTCFTAIILIGKGTLVIQCRISDLQMRSAFSIFGLSMRQG
jgi:hypothetical protein